MKTPICSTAPSALCYCGTRRRTIVSIFEEDFIRSYCLVFLGGGGDVAAETSIDPRVPSER